LGEFSSLPCLDLNSDDSGKHGITPEQLAGPTDP
jgi:hypothetical protein